MAQKNLYVSDRDKPVWKAAERVARRRNVSVAQLVVDALSDYLPRAAAEPDPADRWADIAPDAA